MHNQWDGLSAPSIHLYLTTPLPSDSFAILFALYPSLRHNLVSSPTTETAANPRRISVDCAALAVTETLGAARGRGNALSRFDLDRRRANGAFSSTHSILPRVPRNRAATSIEHLSRSD